jgi:phosphatidylinositol glycan class K
MRILTIIFALLASCTYVLAASNPVAGQISKDDVGAQLGELYGTGNGTATRHTNNWAVLVCASRYWFNYRVSGLSSL